MIQDMHLGLARERVATFRFEADRERAAAQLRRARRERRAIEVPLGARGVVASWLGRDRRRSTDRHAAGTMATGCTS
jgi:hypothetical protein